MPRVYLPLLPIPVLAALVAFSACTSHRSDEPANRLIPPAVAVAPAPPASAATPAPTAPTAENAPSAEELHEFRRPVAK
jgi:hypothetical protein